MTTPPFLRLYPPAHPMGHPALWLWQLCSMNDIEMSGTSDDRQDAIDQATTAMDTLTEVRQ